MREPASHHAKNLNLEPLYPPRLKGSQSVAAHAGTDLRDLHDWHGLTRLGLRSVR